MPACLHARRDRRPRRFLPRLAPALALLALALAGWASSASAAEYEVEVCTPKAAGGDGIEHAFEEPAGKEHSRDPIFFKGCGAAGAGSFQQGAAAGTTLKEGGVHWTLAAPVNTIFHTLKFEQAFSRPGTSSFLDFSLLTDRFLLLHYRDDGTRPLPPSKAETFENIESSLLAGVLGCLTTSPCTGGEFSVIFRNLTAILTDPFPPEVAEPVVPAGALRGAVEVSYTAADAGSGIADVALVVDGTELPGVHDGNGGRCAAQPPYQFLEPCSLKVRSSLALDTTSLPDGPHEVKVAVVDAAGQRTESVPVPFTVHNAPTNTGRPLIAGAAKIGGALTATPGNWDGEPTAFAYQWLRCPAAVTTGADTSGCAPIAGATSPQYSPTADDNKLRDSVRVTAANAAGSESALSGPSDLIGSGETGRPPRKPPVLTHVSLSRKQFRIAKVPTPTGGGTLLGFSSSKAGHLTIAIARVHGKRAKHVATLAAAIKSGRSAVRLNGVIGEKILPPGRYQVTIVVRDAAKNASRPVSRIFTILAH